MSNSPLSLDTGMDVLVRALNDSGVRHIYGVMGDANLGWLSKWTATSGVAYFAARHESGAVAMADGFAADGDRVGVSTVTWGPGLLNALNALGTAARGGRPNVLLLGSLPHSKPFHAQRFDHEALVRPTGALYRAVTDPARIAHEVSVAMRDSLRDGVSIVLDLAAESLESPAVVQVDGPPAPPPATPIPPVSAVAVRAVADALTEARRPIILAGFGVERAGADKALRQVAEHTGARLATTLASRGLFFGATNDIGLYGGFSTPETRSIIESSDVVIAVGASLNEFTTDHGELLAGKTVVHVNNDRQALGRQYAVALGIHADAGEFARALLTEVQSRPPRTAGELGSPVAVHVEQLTDEGDGVGLDPRFAMTMIDRWVPDERAIMIDGGHFIEWPSRYLRAPSPGSFRLGIAGGSLGMAFPQAIGMATRDRSGVTVIVMGDGGFFMSVTELETAVRENIPLLVVVIDDGAYAAEIHKLRALGIDESAAHFPGSADIATVARGFGADAITLQSGADLADLPDVFPLSKPLVVNVKVSLSVVSERLAVTAEPVL